MQSKHCCERMEADLSQVCPTHANRADCPDSLISFDEASGRYGIYVHDGGGSVTRIAFCPWCGASLAGIAPANLDWTELAIKVGSYTPNDQLTKHGGTGYAQRAISELLGDEFIRDAVDVYLEWGPASELARSILRLLLSRTATAYCLALYEWRAPIGWSNVIVSA